MKKKNVQAMLTGMAVMMSVMLPTTSVLAAVPEKEQTVYVCLLYTSPSPRD